MFQNLSALIKDPDTRKAIIVVGVISGIFLMVKSYHEIKLTKLRIEKLKHEE